MVLSVDVTLIFLTMCSHLITSFGAPLGIWLADMQGVHRQTAYALLLFTILHVSCHYINFFGVERQQIRPEKAVQILYTQPAPLTGQVMLFCMFLMFTTAHHRIRQQAYEAFWYTHHLFIPFTLALYTHGTGCFVRDTPRPISPFAGHEFWAHCLGYQSWRWEIIGGGLYLLERLYRALRARQRTPIDKVVKHPYDTVEIRVRKPGMKYRSGQNLLINVPAVSRHQWHPFTITSCPKDPYISIHVRQVGDWTRAFANAVGCGPGEISKGMDPLATYLIALRAGQKLPSVRIDGPYGAPAQDVFQSEVAILIGAGIGITPWASVLKNVWHSRAAGQASKRLKRVELIWICRDPTAFAWFQTLLGSLEAQSVASAWPTFLRFRIYLTQALDRDSMHNIALNSIERGGACDPLTGLRTSTFFGRPDFKRVLAEIRQESIAEIDGPNRGKPATIRTMDCYYSGGTSLGELVQKACRELSTNGGIKFGFHSEHM